MQLPLSKNVDDLLTEIEEADMARVVKALLEFNEGTPREERFECTADICGGFWCGKEDRCNSFRFFVINYLNLMAYIRGVKNTLNRERGREAMERLNES
jgi:hypothetical protein